MTDMLDASMDKVYSMQEQMGNINREMEILSKKKRKKERNAMDQKHYNRNEECLWKSY